jgi:hypothetical protein
MKNQNTKTKNMIVIFIMLLIGIISLGCLDPISAQSAVYVVATSEGGEFNFEGSGDECEWDVHVEGFDLANTDVTNNWGTPSDVRYENIGEGTIFMKVAHKLAGDEFWYFNWLREDIDGNGTYTKGLPGGHSVTVANSTNITGYIVSSIMGISLRMPALNYSADHKQFSGQMKMVSRNLSHHTVRMPY